MPVQAALAPFLAALRAVNADAPRFYPGSPAIAQAMARPGDAIRLCELHAPSADSLRAAIGRDDRVKIEGRDGYEALPAYLPPPERRGLVLIDPPFEEGTSSRRLDFEKMLTVIQKAVRRWPLGTYILWRPLKDLAQVEAFDGSLATALIGGAGIPADKLLVADLWTRSLASEGGLAGAGLVIVNPPYQMREKLAVLLPWLATLLSQDEGAGWRLETAGEG
jgi:23S rRNA (adenine2030-N6)-methyltransferase